MKRIRSYLLLVFLALNGLYAFAQPVNDNCNGALALCSGNLLHASNQNATTEVCTGCADGNSSVGTFCYTVNNTIWFTFTTNSSGGSATVSLANVSCLTAAGFDSDLDITILSATSPCDNATYNILDCQDGVTTTSINLTGLTANTTYYVQIDGNSVGSGVTQPAQCDFDISVDGPAVEVTITTTIINETCAGNDGQITINNVNGALGPFEYSIDGGAFQTSNIFSGLSQGSYTITVQNASGCSYTLSTQEVVGLSGGPSAGTISITAASCTGSNGQIALNGTTGGTAPYQYALNGGANQASNTFSNLPAGLYSVTITDATGCDFTFTNISLTNFAGIQDVEVVIVQPDCDDPTGSITINPIGGLSPYTYSLNGGPATASNTFSGLSPGTYSVVITDNNGCTYTISQIVLDTPFPTSEPTVSITSSATSICEGDQVIFTATATNAGTAPNFEWFINGGLAQNGASSTFSSTTLNNGDVITVELTSNDPCAMQSTASSNAITITVTPQVNPSVTVTQSETQVCQGEAVMLIANTSGCTSGGTYEWFVNGILAATTTTDTLFINPVISSEVIVTFQCNDPCSNPASSLPVNITVTVINVDAGPDQVIGEGQSTQLNGSGTGTYSWDPSNTLTDPAAPDPVATPSSTTTYILTVTNNGCTAQDAVTIYVTELIVIPNTITPNGDGVNDIWEIFRIENYPSCRVTVYDRWGQKVFGATGYRNDNGWDGTFIGASLPAAAYYYVIELNDANGSDPFMGTISIVY